MKYLIDTYIARHFLAHSVVVRRDAGHRLARESDAKYGAGPSGMIRNGVWMQEGGDGIAVGVRGDGGCDARKISSLPAGHHADNQGADRRPAVPDQREGRLHRPRAEPHEGRPANRKDWKGRVGHRLHRIMDMVISALGRIFGESVRAPGTACMDITKGGTLPPAIRTPATGRSGGWAGANPPGRQDGRRRCGMLPHDARRGRRGRPYPAGGAAPARAEPARAGRPGRAPVPACVGRGTKTAPGLRRKR